MKIVQFQVVSDNVMYVLDDKGQLWFRNKQVGGGAWQQVEINIPQPDPSIKSV